MSQAPEPTPPASQPPETNVARVERGRLLQATRNSALQALDAGWRLDGLSAPGGGRLGPLRRLLLDKVVWPLLYPLLARQQEQNAAVIRAAYAAAEFHDQQIVALRHELSYELGRAIKDARELLSQRADDLGTGLAELNERTLRERNLVTQQIRDFAEQLAALEAGEEQLRALLRGEPAPPPTGGANPEGRP